MNFKISLISILTIFFMSFGFQKSLKKKVDKEIKSVFKVEVFTMESILISEEINSKLPARFDDDNFFKIKNDEELLGYAYIAKAPSKTDEFDYLIVLDKDLFIRRSKVLIYREDYGGEIGSKRWLKQFEGKTKNDDLKHGKDIVAISGATISTKSMTNAINNLLKSLKILNSKDII